MTFLVVSASVHLLLLYPYTSNTVYIVDQSLARMEIALVEHKNEPAPIAEAEEHKAVIKQAIEKSVAKQKTTSSKASSPQAARSEIQKQIQTRLAEHFHYPLMAKRYGYQGTVTLSFHIKSNGTLEGIQIAQSSGHGILDRSAVTALLKVYRLKNIEQWLNGNGMNMTLPVRYQLYEG